MPYKLSQDKLSVLKEDGTLVKKHDTPKEAAAHLAALEANVDDADKSMDWMKIGAMISGSNKKKMQAIHDYCVEMGAECSMSNDKHYTHIEVTEDEADKQELNLSYAKSIMGEKQLVLTQAFGALLPKLAVKFTARDEIQGYTFLWGNQNLTDVEIEYFTKGTNFWDTQLGKSPRPLTWDHAQDAGFKGNPVIGNITDFGDDEIGRRYVAKLDTAHQYRKAIDELIKKGVLGTSSDSAPQYVVREKTGKSVWLKEWPWFASALTNTPAEPRMIGSLEFLKSLGVTLPDVGDTRSRFDYKKRQAEVLKLNQK